LVHLAEPQVTERVDSTHEAIPADLGRYVEFRELPGREVASRKPLPVSESGGLTDAGIDVRELIAKYDWPVAEALAVAWCESRFDPAAYNAGNYGAFQINRVHAARVGGNLDALFDAATNVRIAHDIYKDAGGWGPWACKP
jgi:soluble lytic murein transglycosylase-like protein